MKVFENSLLLMALACGTGAEIFLRSKFYLKQKSNGDNVEKFIRGPFDLLQWYQNFWFDQIASKMDKVAIREAAKIKKFIKANLPPIHFLPLCGRVNTNADAFQSSARDGIRERIKAGVDDIKKGFESEGIDSNAPGFPQLEERYRQLLGFTMYKIVGETGFNTLVR